MCGIAGILNRSEPADKSVLLKMGQVIAHRGPDGKGEYLADTAGFVHRRLSIIDLASGAQPMISADGRYVIVFNGELYNYVELRDELKKKGRTFRTTSDTEVLLQAYIEYGRECLERLVGMFAFAVYDTAARTTFLARDHFGVKPLYYTEFADGVAFASEIKALLEHPAIPAELNRGALYEYLTFQFCLDDRTLFHGVRKLEPASFMLVRDGKVAERGRYWSVDFTVDAHHTEEFFHDELARLLRESVRLQLRSDVPLGAYLSGGLDSSAVTCYASEILGTPIGSFSGGFKDGPQYDETGYARAVAEAAGTDHHEIYPTARDFVESMETLVYHMDEPAAGPGLFPQYFVSKMASDHVKVVLGGQGGDEIFGGYARYMVGYLEQCIKSAIFEQQEEGRFVVTLDTIIPNLPLLKQYVPMIKHFWSDGTFGPMDERYFHLINRLGSAQGLYTDELMSGYSRERVLETFKGMFNSPDTLSYFNKMTHFDMLTLLPALLQVEDRMSMAVSLESRVPLLDHRIVNLVASMPPSLKFANGKTKHIFRQVVKNKVPAAVMQRKDKMGFPVPLSEWMQKGPVREFVLDVLLSDRAKQRGVFNPAQIENQLAGEQAFGRSLWGALNLELWFRRFID